MRPLAGLIELLHDQLEFVVEISNFQCTLRIDMLQYIESYLFLQRTLTVMV